MKIEVIGLDSILPDGVINDVVKLNFSPPQKDRFDYSTGFDVKLKDGAILRVRVTTMPSADTAFYIEE